MFLKLMGIDSICSRLLKAVGLLAVRLDLTKPRLKNHIYNLQFKTYLNLNNYGYKYPLLVGTSYCHNI